MGSQHKSLSSPLVAAMALTLLGSSALASNETSGKATIYSDSYNGKKTATGETYRSKEVSAASNKLPLGSKVLIQNKKTGKSAVVKINDRMSTHVPAVVDLSKGAAKEIGVTGTGQIRAKVVEPAK